LREYLTLEELRSFSFDHIRQLQNTRFSAICHQFLPHVPFYAKLFKDHGVDPLDIECVEDWHTQGLPLIKKATYKKRPRDFIVSIPRKQTFKTHTAYLKEQDRALDAFGLLLSPDKKQQLKDYYHPKMLIFSGGTESGNPTPVAITARQKFHVLEGVLSIIGTLVLEKYKSDKLVGMNLFPYAPHLGWHAVHHALDLHADLNLCTAAGGAMPTERLVALAKETQPTIICGMSDYLRHRFLPLAIKQKVKLPKRVLFINGAQKMHDAERKQIKDLARKAGASYATVLDLYGASEYKTALLPELWPGSGYYHIAPLSTIIRTVDVQHSTKELIDEWNFSPNGYAASWNLDGAGSLLHGYFLGDKYDRVVEQKCSKTGLHVKRLYGINRIQNVEAQMELTGMVEEKVKGSRVDLSGMRANALSIPGVREAQIVLNRKKKQIIVNIVADKKTVKSRVEKAFAGAEITPTVKLVKLDNLQTDKPKFEGVRIIDA